ncbi:hypothetical protein WG906_13385 [Pedobacter sp. P351]|uniref:hypothetical protein n=1 Tax=Pedobacter superstes TaxID=3133441 RepID=UPI0030A0B5EF
MKLTPTRYSYPEFIEFSIYGDLKSSFKPNDRLTLNSDEEFEDVQSRLSEIKVPFLIKSKREIWIASADL